MLPKKELQALANTLKATPEFNRMVKQRRLIMQDAKLSRAMLTFEREHAKIMRYDFPEDKMAIHIKNLFNDNKIFLETDEVKSYNFV